MVVRPVKTTHVPWTNTSHTRHNLQLCKAAFVFNQRCEKKVQLCLKKNVYQQNIKNITVFTGCEQQSSPQQVGTNRQPLIGRWAIGQVFVQQSTNSLALEVRSNAEQKTSSCQKWKRK